MPVQAAERAVARAALNVDATDVVAVWVGTLDELKDPLTPIEAAHTVRDEGLPFVLLVAGHGPLRAAVDQAVAGNPGARTLGFRNDIGSLLAAADVFVVSSRREGLSFSVLEAMARGLPTVASEVAGNVRALGDAGMFARYGDAAGFADAFRVLASDADARTRLGAEARSRADRLYSLEGMLAGTRDVYASVSQDGRRTHRA
jgi:glycosyltransferase involved in cell wall biosynthesis